MLVRIIILYLIVVFLLVFFLPGLAYVFAQTGNPNPAHPPMSSPAHDYPVSCCGANDCNPVPENAIRETSEGYVIGSTGEVIPHGDPRVLTTPHEWDVQGWHWCRHIRNGVDGKTICLYRPDRGV